MLADLLFRANDPAGAAFYFEKLLEKHPNNYGALYRLLLLLKRSGRLAADGPRFLKMAARGAPTENDPGYRFCL